MLYQLPSNVNNHKTIQVQHFLSYLIFFFLKAAKPEYFKNSNLPKISMILCTVFCLHHNEM